MSKYIGTPVVNVSVDTVDVTGDITTTDTTPEVIIVNNTHEDTDGGREGKVTFKGQQSGGEEPTLAQIQASHDGTSDDEKGDLIFKTNDGSDGASPTERMRIDSAGKVGIGLTNAADYFADNLVVQAPAEGGITIVSTATTNNAYLMFADGTSGNEAYRGYIAYAHNSPENLQVVSYGYTRFYTSADGSTATERMRINANGNVHIADNQNGADAALHIEKTTPQLRLQINGNSGYNTIESGGSNELIFGRSGTEHMRIDSSGQVGINETPVTTTGSAAMLHVDSAGQYNSGKIAAIFQSSARGTIRVRSPNDNPAEIFWDVNDGARWLMSCRNSGSSYQMNWYNANSSASLTAVGTAVMTLSQTGNLTISGALSKGSGSFKIDHPLPAKSDTHHLVHSFLEGPQADLIYRGKVDLVDGSATVNIDTVSSMTDGTFVLLCDNVQCFTSNEDGWTAIKGSVSGNTLTITAQDNTCTDTVSWMVIGERKDQHMIDTDWTDENGKVIVEPLKPQDEEEGE